MDDLYYVTREFAFSLRYTTCQTYMYSNLNNDTINTGL